MIDMDEIERAISMWENADTTYSSCAKLADLYAVRDHLINNQSPYDMASSYSAKPSEALGDYGDSDFLQAVSGKDGASVWAIMDDLMDTLQVVNPKVYTSIMRKICIL